IQTFTSRQRDRQPERLLIDSFQRNPFRPMVGARAHSFRSPGGCSGWAVPEFDWRACARTPGSGPPTASVALLTGAHGPGRTSGRKPAAATTCSRPRVVFALIRAGRKATAILPCTTHEAAHRLAVERLGGQLTEQPPVSRGELPGVTEAPAL